MRNLTLTLAACALLGLPVACAWADEGNAFNVVLSEYLAYDDNVFRLQDGVSPTGFGSRGDHISNTYIGLTFEKLLGRQKLRARLAENRVRYRRFDFLDYDGVDAEASVDYQVGNALSGTAGLGRTESLTDFGDFRRPIKNINTFDRQFVRGAFRFHPRWSTLFGLEHETRENSTVQRRASDSDVDRYKLGMRLHMRSGNQIDFTLTQTDGEYPKRPPSLIQTRRYEQTQATLQLDWRPGPDGRLVVSAGRLRRDDKDGQARDFSGTVASAVYDWQVTGASALHLEASQRLGADDDVLSSFTQTRTYVIAPQWRASAKLMFEASWQRREREYLGDPFGLIAAGFGAVRSDETDMLSIGATWLPWRNLSLNANLRHETRDSNLPGLEYEDTIASASVQYGF